MDLVASVTVMLLSFTFNSGLVSAENAREFDVVAGSTQLIHHLQVEKWFRVAHTHVALAEAPVEEAAAETVAAAQSEPAIETTAEPAPPVEEPQAVNTPDPPPLEPADTPPVAETEPEMPAEEAIAAAEANAEAAETVPVEPVAEAVETVVVEPAASIEPSAEVAEEAAADAMAAVEDQPQAEEAAATQEKEPWQAEGPHRLPTLEDLRNSALRVLAELAANVLQAVERLPDQPAGEPMTLQTE